MDDKTIIAATMAGDRLGNGIEESVLIAVSQLDSSVVGFRVSDYDVEDPAETDQDENDWPVILVRKSDGQRFSVEAMVTVNPLPALVDVQQPSPMALMERRGRRSGWVPLRLQAFSCSKCGDLLIAGWVDRDGAHASCGHLATMRASHPEWFADTANQTALPIGEPS